MPNLTPPDVIECARQWIGTAFHHQGRLKRTALHHGGVDCLGLLMGIANELALTDKNGIALSNYDRTDYSHTPNQQQLHEKLALLLTPVEKSRMDNADIALLAIEGQAQHLGIIATGTQPNNVHLIHAYAQARKVVEHTLTPEWRSSIVQLYRLPCFID